MLRHVWKVRKSFTVGVIKVGPRKLHDVPVVKLEERVLFRVNFS